VSDIDHEEPLSLANGVSVAQVMSGEVVCVKGDTSVEQLTKLFLERGISGVPVLNDDGKPIGMVSKTDLVREAYERSEGNEEGPTTVSTKEGYLYDLGPGYYTEEMAGASASDIMTPVVYALRLTDTLSQAAALMAVQGIHRLPVLTEEEKVTGLVSSLDIMRWLAEQDGYLPMPEGELDDR
jgi:CBS domain-containing protein